MKFRLPVRHSMLLSLLSLSTIVAAAGTALSQVVPTHQGMSRIYIASDSPVSVVGIDPARTISGPRTGLKAPFGVAVDKRRNELVVANRALYHGRAPGSIVSLPIGQGNIPATSMISCRGFNFWAVVLDASGNIVTGDLASSSVITFARDANGCPRPLSVVGGSQTGISSPVGVAFDRHQRLVVLNFNGSIDIFGAGSSGNVAPVTTISGSQTGLAGGEALAVDRAGNLYVANYATGSLLEFTAGSSGNVAPIRTISGSQTMLRNPIGVAVDRAGFAYVADYGTNAILVFSKQASGDSPPMTVIRTPQPTAITLSR